MTPTVKQIGVVLFTGYIILTCYTAYILISKSTTKTKREVQKIWSLSGEDEWNPWGEDLEQEKNIQTANANKPKVKWWSNKTLDYGKPFSKTSDSHHYVEVWAKSAIGLYLWEHILGGKIEKKMNGVWSYGFKKIDNIKLKFRTGPGVIPSKVPNSVQHVVLTLNGRDVDKISFARMWLDFLPQLPLLRSVAVVLLGDEECNNDWLLPYMAINKGIVNVTFIVYDSPLVDNDNFFQWPLGVATYRNFPKVDPKHLSLDEPRPFTCNFFGTVYPNSSRTDLLKMIYSNHLEKQCLIRFRSEWVPSETKDSLDAYTSALELSDLTISPVGRNTECYRIYEALSMGSVPVVEDVMTPGKCGGSESYRGHLATSGAPLRLLKAYDAPVIYFSNMDELYKTIEKEFSISPAEKIRRRKNVVTWYEEFKVKLRDFFISVLKKKFSIEER